METLEHVEERVCVSIFPIFKNSKVFQSDYSIIIIGLYFRLYFLINNLMKLRYVLV